MLIIDFETRSKVDLATAGAYLYAEDPSTSILCMGWRDGITNKSGVWVPGQPVDRHLAAAFRNPEVMIGAWNANFDRLIYDNCEHPFPPLPLSRWVCLSATARLNALPAGLDNCHRVLFGGKRGKDVKGKQLIDALCTPDADGNFYFDLYLLLQLYDYCQQDVAAAHACWAQMRQPTKRERRDYHVNERINDNGVHIDRELCLAATEYAYAERKALSEELSRLTEGEITAPTQTQRIRDFVYSRVSSDTQRLMTVYKKGDKKISLDKRIRENILAAADDGSLTVPDTVYDVIMCAHEGSNTSVAKFKRMAERADTDTDRACGAFLHAGASQTHRYASRGVQLHNFRRDTFTPSTTEAIRRDMLEGKPLMSVMETLSKMLRSAITPEPGNCLVVADWEQVEARVLPWLTNDARAESRLKAFADGEDIYRITADAIGEADRQIGKVAELSLGFGGGAGAFASMARNFGVTLPVTQIKQIVATWRAANPWATSFWIDLSQAARNAMRRPDTPFYVGRVSYTFNPNLLGGTLVCTLPCGTTIQYPFARLEFDEQYQQHYISAIKANWTPAWDAKEWPRVRLWHGLLAENVTQATAASLLRTALADLHMLGWDIVAHVHDEIVMEVPIDMASEAERDMEEVMTDNRRWAEGLPLAVDVKVMKRYGK